MGGRTVCRRRPRPLVRAFAPVVAACALTVVPAAAAPSWMPTDRGVPEVLPQSTVMPVTMRALALPAQHGAGQRAGLARLVAGHRRVVRHLVAGATDHWRTLSELAPVGCVGGHDAVLAVEQDVGLGQGVEVGSEFGQRGAAAMGGQWGRDHEDGA